jgi:leucyl/phenylalanyl-tRNA--protein transferase
MGSQEGGVRWYSPDPRGILPLYGFRTPHGLRQALRKSVQVGWEIRIDTDFDGILKGCAEHRETWITGIITRSYRNLFDSGHAHSIEVWSEGKLAGGLYGVAIGGAFFGESMFHRITNASKVALWHLVRILKMGGFTLLDTQWVTPHLKQFGAIEIASNDYLAMLKQALAQKGELPRPGYIDSEFRIAAPVKHL